MVQILGSVWFSVMYSQQSIGIILINNGVEEKAYIGIVEGHDQEADEQFIAKNGTPFPVETAKTMI